MTPLFAAIHGAAAPAPLPLALLLLFLMAGAGVAHTLWLRSRWSLRFAVPIDAGRTFRQRRLLGDNKTWRGLMAIVPTAGLLFLLLGLVRPQLPAYLRQGAWDLPAWSFGVVGLVAALGFMLGELPNSFMKRQLDVAPGSVASGRGLRQFCLVLDRLDSTLGLLIALSLVVPMAAATWGYALLLGPGVHWLFSVMLYRLRVKARAC